MQVNYNAWDHGCQNCDPDCKITRFNDPTSPKSLKL